MGSDKIKTKNHQDENHQMRRVAHFILIKSCTERLASHKSCWLELLPISMAEQITVNENRIPMIKLDHLQMHPWADFF